MINYRIIARVFSQVLIFEGLFMLICAVVSLICREHDAGSFLFSALITLITGVLVFTPLRHEEKVYGTREGYIINIGIWLIFSIFGTLPFILSGYTETFWDAFFESMSGFTTTGATIFPDVESLPRGILFWRSLTQWLGGLTTIALSLYVVPVIKTLNIQLSANEFSGLKADKIHPKIKETAKRLISIFIILTLIQTLLLVIGKMPLFDAICHSFSTLSTGGFSTRNNGIASFSSPYLRTVIVCFMFLAGMNLTVVYFALKGKFKKIAGNSEFIFYALLIFSFSILVSVLLFSKQGSNPFKSVGDGFFHVISILTTTGYYTENFSQWSYFLVMIIFVLMFTGGMAGSASGGIKIIRLLIITKNNRNESRRLIHPNALFPVRSDRRIISQNTVYNLLVFIALYFMVLCAGTLVISYMGNDIITSFSTSASMLGNIGPGIGNFGPFTCYGDLPSAGKLFLCCLMFLGRLELLTVIVIFTRGFYAQ